MRRCPYCKVDIAGDNVKCPLCQSKLQGSDEEPCYPKFESKKKQSLFYKIQLFLVWCLLIVGIGLDFMIGFLFNSLCCSLRGRCHIPWKSRCGRVSKTISFVRGIDELRRKERIQ